MTGEVRSRIVSFWRRKKNSLTLSTADERSTFTWNLCKYPQMIDRFIEDHERREPCLLAWAHPEASLKQTSPRNSTAITRPNRYPSYSANSFNIRLSLEPTYPYTVLDYLRTRDMVRVQMQFVAPIHVHRGRNQLVRETESLLARSLERG